MEDQKEEQAIFAETEAFGEAWSKADAKAAASFFTEDGTRVGAFGDIQNGRAEIEAAYDRLLNKTMSGAQMTQDRGSIRMLTPELALWQGKIEITPLPGAKPMKGHVVQIMKKVNDRWLIVEAHPKFFPSS